MLYSPHILKKKFVNKVVNKYNEVIGSSEEWKEMGRCRCDDNSTEHFTTENGSIYTPKYHIVCDKCQISKVMKSRSIPMMEATEEVERSIMPLSAIILVI